MDDPGFMIMGVCALAHFLVGRALYRKGLLLAATSLVVWAATTYGLGWKWLLSLGPQLGIFGALTIFRAFRASGVKW